MELLEKFGVSGELSRREFERRLARADSGGVKDLRFALYEDAYRRGLMAVYAPVERRKYGGKSLKEKHVEDVWELMCAIRDKREVPRTLLRNGKRSRCEWLRSQEKIEATEGTMLCEGGGSSTSHSIEDTVEELQSRTSVEGDSLGVELQDSLEGVERHNSPKVLDGVCSGEDSNRHEAATCESERELDVGTQCMDGVTAISFHAAVVKDMNELRSQVESLQRSLYLIRSQQVCGSQEQGDGSNEWEHKPEDQYSNTCECYAVPIKHSCELYRGWRGAVSFKSRVWRKEAVGSRNRVLGFSHSQLVPAFVCEE